MVLASVLFILGTCSLYAADSIKKVCIQQFMEHPALNRTIQGIIDGLKRKGYKQGVNLDLSVESAQGSPALASQIAVKFLGKNPDVVVGIATVSAQSFRKYTKSKKIKLVFSSITDPVKAELVKSLNKPGNQTSGVSNYISLEPQIKVFRTIQPSLKRLGFLYNPGEVNSLSLIKELEDLCSKFGISLVLQAATKTSEVSQAATILASKVDAIFISNDSTALSTLQTIIQAAKKVKVPVYVSDTDALEQGAVAALGPNQYKIGLQTAEIIIKCFKGQDLDSIPVEFPDTIELYLNEEAARSIGIEFPDSLKMHAAKIITHTPS